MSRNFLTIQQAYAKLGAGSSSSNNFITKAQLVATGRVDADRLSGYSDHHFVVDDDIIEKAVDWPFKVNISLNSSMDRATIYVESIYYEVVKNVRLRSTTPIRVFDIASGQCVDETYIDVVFEPGSVYSENAKDLYVPWYGSNMNWEAPWSDNIRIEVPDPSAFTFDPPTSYYGITEIIFFHFLQGATTLYP